MISEFIPSLQFIDQLAHINYQFQIKVLIKLDQSPSQQT